MRKLPPVEKGKKEKYVFSEMPKLFGFRFFFLEIEADNQIKIDRRLASSRWNALEFCAQIENVGKNCEFVISSHTDSCIAQFIDIAARLVCIPLSDLFHRKKSTCTHLNRDEGGKKVLYPNPPRKDVTEEEESGLL